MFLRILAGAFLLLARCSLQTSAQLPGIDPITLRPVETKQSSNGADPSKSVYRVGGGVKPPKPIISPDPEYTKAARKAKRQGIVVLWMVVGADGLPRDIKVIRSLDVGLDQKAMEAVRKWRFEPATRDGVPVAVQINVEVDFRLY